MVCQEDTRELVVHDRHLNGYVVCSDVIDKPMVCQEDTRELVVHDRLEQTCSLLFGYYRRTCGLSRRYP